MQNNFFCFHKQASSVVDGSSLCESHKRLSIRLAARWMGAGQLVALVPFLKRWPAVWGDTFWASFTSCRTSKKMTSFSGFLHQDTQVFHSGFPPTAWLNWKWLVHFESKAAFPSEFSLNIKHEKKSIYPLKEAAVQRNYNQCLQITECGSFQPRDQVRHWGKRWDKRFVAFTWCRPWSQFHHFKNCEKKKTLL